MTQSSRVAPLANLVLNNLLGLLKIDLKYTEKRGESWNIAPLAVLHTCLQSSVNRQVKTRFSSPAKMVNNSKRLE
jgi:hypothetical protein